MTGILPTSDSLQFSFITVQKAKALTLKAPIRTAADDIHKHFFIVFSEKIRLDVSSESSGRSNRLDVSSESSGRGFT